MLTILKQFIHSHQTPEEDATPAGARLRMSLDERKAYRREMLYQSIRENLLALEALSSMYKFKVMSTDERHHRFMVMIEVTGMFQAVQGGQVLGLPQIEALIRKRTYERYGVVIDGMFWRLDESIPTYTRARRADDPQGMTLKPFSPNLRHMGTRLARKPYEPVTAMERERFAQAVREGQRPPPLRVGAQEYATDLMPLEGAPV